MTIVEIKKEIIKVIAKSTQTDVVLTEDTRLVKEMGLSSVEIMMLISDLEDRFGIRIPSAKLRTVKTVKDLSQIVIDQLKKQQPNT